MDATTDDTAGVDFELAKALVTAVVRPAPGLPSSQHAEVDILAPPPQSSVSSSTGGK